MVRLRDSNPRPPAPKADALPTELSRRPFNGLNETDASICGYLMICVCVGGGVGVGGWVWVGWWVDVCVGVFVCACVCLSICLGRYGCVGCRCGEPGGGLGCFPGPQTTVVSIDSFQTTDKTRQS